MHNELFQEIEGTWGTPEAARFLGCTESTLRAWVSQGRVPYVKLGRLTRFLKSDLASHVAKHRVEAADSAPRHGLQNSALAETDHSGESNG